MPLSKYPTQSARHSRSKSRSRQTTSPAYQYPYSTLSLPTKPPRPAHVSYQNSSATSSVVPQTLQPSQIGLAVSEDQANVSGSDSNTSSNAPMAKSEITRCPKASDAILDRLSKLLGDSSLSDFTIVCKDREWQVHRFVLTLHSTVLQAACTHGFKEEKERRLDLSDEDTDSVGAFVYYLYNLNYDASLFRESGDHLSMHVQMCILGDKYDMRPLQDLAVEKFRKQTTDSAPTGNDLADAAICAYDAIGATAEIRKIIVKLAIEQKLIPTEISAEPVNDFERAMQSSPGFCLDIVKVQQSMIATQPKSFKCPALCGNAVAHPITLATAATVYRCTNCVKTYYGWQWGQYAVL